MTWKTVDTMMLRHEFIALALQEGANRRELCRRFGISPKTAYKWLHRFALEGQEGLQDRSRRPQSISLQTCAEIERAVVALRQAHPTWGGRKIHHRLLDLGHVIAPAPSTISHILHRNGLINPTSSTGHVPWHRFEHEQPNALWQIDFKGNFPTLKAMCYPLTVLDDHSRFNLVLQACVRPNSAEVQKHLINAFKRYGMPVRFNADNGAPWGSPREPAHGITPLTIWLIRLGIRVSHSRPAHPQTNGKEERFHRTLKADVLQGCHFTDLVQVQGAFDRWRTVYNMERPHEGIQMATPITRYRSSPLPYSEVLAPIEYETGTLVLKVGWNGVITFGKRMINVPKALQGYTIAVKPANDEDGVHDLYFCHQRFMQIDLNMPKK